METLLNMFSLIVLYNIQVIFDGHIKIIMFLAKQIIMASPVKKCNFEH